MIVDICSFFMHPSCTFLLPLLQVHHLLIYRKLFRVVRLVFMQGNLSASPQGCCSSALSPPGLQSFAQPSVCATANSPASKARPIPSSLYDVPGHLLQRNDQITSLPVPYMSFPYQDMGCASDKEVDPPHYLSESVSSAMEEQIQKVYILKH